MRRRGLRGVVRGKVVRTTAPDKAVPCPLDSVNRHFKADRPDQLWVSDFTNARPGRDGCTSPSSSTYTSVGSWAGGSARRCTPTSLWMPSSRRCTAGSLTATDPFITPIVGLSTSAFATPKGWPKQGPSHQSAVGSRQSGRQLQQRMAETMKGLKRAELIHRRGP
jgi:putative transposase